MTPHQRTLTLTLTLTLTPPLCCRWLPLRQILLPTDRHTGASSLFRELDYRGEAANGLEFRRLFGGRPGVYVPEMLPQLTSRRVLVMEWVDGERLVDVVAAAGGTDVTGQTAAAAAAAGNAASGGGGNGSRPARAAAAAEARRATALALVDVGVRCSLEQMLEEGFYHADPHPGNLLIRARTNELVYLDFGMMGCLAPRTRRGLLRAVLHSEWPWGRWLPGRALAAHVC